MKIDYTKYTVPELLDVNENIDAEQFPERYNLLQEEIERRKTNKEFYQQIEEYDENEDNDFEANEIIIEFSSEDRSRKLFIGAFFLINLAVLAYMLPKYIVTDISDVHEYATEIDFIECREIDVINNETDEVSTYFDLNMTSFGSQFSAISIDGGKCHKLAKELKVGSAVSIWHEDGLIHQLKYNDKMKLSYAYLKSKVRNFRTDDVDFYWFGLVFLWVALFKSLVNAIVPGTFLSKDD